MCTSTGSVNKFVFSDVLNLRKCIWK